MTGQGPASDDICDNAHALHAQGRAVEAEAAYEAVLARQPGHGDALHGLGVLYLQTGRTDRAIAVLEKAVAASGGAVIVRNNLGVALCAAGRLPEAVEVYRAILRADPASVAAHLNLGKILNALGAFAQAMPVLERAQALAPGHATVREQLAQALAGTGEAMGASGRHHEAVAYFDRAIALMPDLAHVHHNRGTALTYLGRRTDAVAAFARAVALAPDAPAYRRAMLGVETVTASNPHLKVLEELEAAGRLEPTERIAVPFALAKAYEDLGDYARAFAAMTRGNAAKRAGSHYKLATDLDRFRALAAQFTPAYFAAHAADGFASALPVFIVGMPRSGTTLVEQILASHPDVFGAGELGILPEMINAGMAGPAFPAGVAALGADRIAGFGKAYVEKLGAHAPEATRVTDKLPLNFQLVGLLSVALPEARIIHVRRDPMDTCLSCYSVLFEDDLDFTCDLDDLAEYYKGYAALMAHWRAVLPPGRMLEIRYEELVADPETHARRLIDYCGLTWDARCLNFHETVRPIETASALQVRRPLYRTSVGRAERFRPWIEPLRRALAGCDQL